MFNYLVSNLPSFFPIFFLFGTKTHFETKMKGNSEMAFILCVFLMIHLMFFLLQIALFLFEE